MRYLPIVLFVAFSIVFWHRMGVSESLPELALIDEALPAFELPTLERKSRLLTNGDIAKGTYFINVFASTCAPCLMEHPVLHAMPPLYKVPIIGINVEDNPKDAEGWLKLHGNPYDKIGRDDKHTLISALGITSPPETLVVHNGRIRYRHSGPLREHELKLVIPRIIRQLDG